MSEHIRTSTTTRLFKQIRCIPLGRSCRNGGIGIAFGAFLCAAPFLYGQNRARFDVISIKRNATKSPSGTVMNTPDGIRALNMPLSLFVYRDVNPALVVGAPKWLSSERYDVIAKVDGSRLPLTVSDRDQMIQSMLQDRLQLRDHSEIRNRPIFKLTVVKSGAKLKPATPGHDYSNGVKRPGGAPAGAGLFVKPGARPRERRFVGQDASMAELARQMSYMPSDLNRLVVDATGLKGRYDFTLDWMPPSEADNSGPSLFTALADQLGLRLVSTTGPVKVLVIDHIERPSAN